MVLVLGIGNSLLQDEGIAFHLLKRLRQEKAHWPVKFLDGGTLSFNLASVVESCSHLIVIDAANLNSSPGSVQSFFDLDLDKFLNKPGKSVHEVSLSDLFDMTRLTDTIPMHRAMVAVQPKNISWGENLTPLVEDSQTTAIEHIKKALIKWGILAVNEELKYGSS